MKQLFLLIGLSFLTLVAAGQEVSSSRIRGLRVTGEAKSHFPVANLDSNPVLIEFDLNDTHPDDFRIRFYQCDSDWNVVQNAFINDEMRNSTKFPIPYMPSPQGVQYYRFHYTLRVPGFPGVEKFAYSGNYIFEIWDKDQVSLLGKGRFFVAEHRVPISLSINNRYLPSTGAPLNQVNKIQLGVTVTDDAMDETDRLIANYIRTVYIYKNREFGSPYRIDVDDQNPNTFVDGFGTNSMKFMVDNVLPGNEYRRLDLTNVDFYPAGQLLKLRGGADVDRMFHQGPPDQNGESVVLTDSRYSDYVNFQFELDRESDDVSPVYVVGDFNDWQPSEAWKMKYDSESQRYTLQAEMRRGVYDYQYVCNGNDWSRLEGNDWRTVNTFTVFLYYHDIRFGGFDRIISVGQKFSPGGTEATTN